MSTLAAGVALLAAAVLLVPLFGRLGLGAVLGYLAAGVVVGPHVLGLFPDPEAIRHDAELGVVLLLFVIGLELQPSRLWSMRRSLAGLGAAQVLVSSGLLAVACLAFGVPPGGALLAGFALALSSTAFALQTLDERAELATRHGRSAFAVLLFQDLAIIPVLAVLPLLAPGAGDGGHGVDAVKTIGILAAVLIGGRFVLRHALRLIARANMREVFTACALLVALGTAWLMQVAGLSMALGAFIAGVLLADSEFRHELEANIEPFKGLLLGLFFMTVGMSVDLALLGSEPARVLALVATLISVKMVVLLVIGKVSGLDWRRALALAIAISQGGEFAFVLLGIGAAAGLVATGTASLLTLAVTLSMAVTPLLFALYDRLPAARDERAYDTVPDETTPVVIAGFGRFGQMAGRILRARGIAFTALDASARQVDFVREFGNKVFYGDASKQALLHAARVREAKVFILAIDDVDASLATAALVREHYPHVHLLARASDRRHAYQLMDLGVQLIRRETLLSSLDIAREMLVALGDTPAEAAKAVDTFREHDERRLMMAHADHTDHDRMVYLAQEAGRELEELFSDDARGLRQVTQAPAATTKDAKPLRPLHNPGHPVQNNSRGTAVSEPENAGVSTPEKQP